MLRQIKWTFAICFLLSALAAHACSCGSRGSACEAAWRVDAVFSGKVTLILPGFDGDVLVRFAVSEAFRGLGSDQKAVWVSTPMSEPACGFNFDLGKQYLVYGWKAKDALIADFQTSICSRTWKLEHAGVDVAYLRTIPQQPETSRIFGDFKLYTFDEDFVPKVQASIMDHYPPKEEDAYAIQPMVGADIQITPLDGPVQARMPITVKTDSAGAYEAIVSAGSYLVSAKEPLGYTPLQQEQVTAHAKGCGTVHFRSQANGTIRGKLISSKGEALGKVMVYLVRPKTPSEPLRQQMTDAEGTFEFREVPAGRLALRSDGSWTQNDRFAETFYPNSPTVDGARILTLRPGQKAEGLTFVLRDKNQ